MENWKIDINCDVGEGVGNEAQLFPLISSCNVACGGHAGDTNSMLEIVQLAKKHKVKVGAHPSYPDKENFGRTVLDIPDHDLRESIKRQLEDFGSVLNQSGVHWNHIKAHGALYNETAKNTELAELFLETLKDIGEKVPLYVPYGSVIAKLAVENDFEIRYEAFGDRNYNTDLSLVSRKLPNALIHKPQSVLEHVLPIIKSNKIVTSNGQVSPIEADTLCIHGDTPEAFEILTYLSKQLPKHQVTIIK